MDPCLNRDRVRRFGAVSKVQPSANGLLLASSSQSQSMVRKRSRRSALLECILHPLNYCRGDPDNTGQLCINVSLAMLEDVLGPGNIRL